VSQDNSAKIINKLLLRRDEAERHVTLLTGLADRSICVRLIHDRDRSKPARNLTGPLDELWPEIIEAQADGYGVFVVVNEGGHKAKEITAIRAVVIDGDNVPTPATWHIKPSFIVRRSATRWHAYWLTDDLSLEQFTPLQKRLAAHYGTDPSISDLPRVMRLAGTVHQKATPTLITLEDTGNGLDVWAMAPIPSVHLAKGLPELSEQKREARAAPDMELDLAGNVLTATKYLQSLPHVIIGEGSDHAAYSAAATVLELGISTEKTFELMMGHFKCTPKDPEWIREKVEHAAEYMQNQAGASAVASGQEAFGESEIVKATAEAKPKRSRYYPVGTDEMEAAPPTPWLVRELIQEGTTVLMVGETQSYKSFLALDLALAIAAGCETFGAKPLQGPTFYAALEGLHGIKGDRRRAWCIAREIEGPPDFYALPAPPVASSAECEEFIEQVRLCCDARPDHRRPRLIVLETANKIMGGMDENSARDAGTLVKLCDELVRVFGCAVLMIHHKSDKVGAAEVRGSSAFQAGFDTLLSVDAVRSLKTVKVHVRKHKDAAERETPFTFQGHVVAGSLVFEPITAAEYQEKVIGADGYSRRAVGQALKDLAAFGPPGVTTYVLAAKLVPPSNPNESVTEREKNLKTVQNRLGERAQPGKSLCAYAYPGTGPRGATMWYLPEYPEAAD